METNLGVELRGRKEQWTAGISRSGEDSFLRPVAKGSNDLGDGPIQRVIGTLLFDHQSKGSVLIWRDI